MTAAWPGVGFAGDILDNHLAEGKMKPMVVVMPDGSMSVEQFTEDIVNDIIPCIESRYKVLTGVENRGMNINYSKNSSKFSK
ncbi:MAG: hypothetical protein JXA61_08745 [Bacteroidales bacterium]|nr:hypothetical protein [Bacteroidales bacterium]